MSFLDRLAAAVTPAASDEDRAEARRKFASLAEEEPFARDILDAHRQIESLFAKACGTSDQVAANRAVQDLATLLTGHSMAEEAVIYPGVAEFSGKTHASMAYEEQAMAKVQIAKLQDLEPLSDAWREKLDHVKSAVEQHVYQEEDSWFPELIENAPPEKRAQLSRKYREEFERYCGSPGTSASGVPDSRELA